MSDICVILPAHDEAGYLPACLSALFASRLEGLAAQVVVVANGCTDHTAEVARGFADTARGTGWQLEVIETEVGDKLNALVLGEAATRSERLVYLDADVIVSPGLIAALARVMDPDHAVYATGTAQLALAKSFVTRAYGRFWEMLPFVTQAAPGFGLFAMTRKGRARWDDWPRIISDDTFARLSFSAAERVQVADTYTWPLVEGFSNLVRVRRRQNRGVDEVRALFPDLPGHQGDPRVTKAEIVTLALRRPVGFVVYALVSLAVKLPGGSGWVRGR